MNVSLEKFPHISAVLVLLLNRATRPADSGLEPAFKEFCTGRSEPEIYSAESYMSNLLSAAPERLQLFLSSPDVILDEDQSREEFQYFSSLFGSEEKLEEAHEVIWGLFAAVETLPKV